MVDIDEKKRRAKEYGHNRHLLHGAEVRARVKKWASENKERVNATKRRSYLKNKHKDKSHKMKNRYGITLEEFNKIKESQNNLCAICAKSANKFVPDHDHANGLFRAALCYKCNLLLGHCDDNIEILTTAINYLIKHNNRSGKK